MAACRSRRKMEALAARRCTTSWLRLAVKLGLFDAPLHPCALHPMRIQSDHACRHGDQVPALPHDPRAGIAVLK